MKISIYEELKNEIGGTIKVMENCKNSPILLNKLETVIVEVIKTIERGSKLLFMGNGGSAAEAQHMAAEYVGRFNFPREPLAAIALTTDTSIISAIGNDYGYEFIFSRQVKALGKKGDLLFGYTTSGNSENVIEALSVAKGLGITTVVFTGDRSEKVCENGDYILTVPSPKTSHIQECHTLFGHLICGRVEKEVFKNNNNC